MLRDVKVGDAIYPASYYYNKELNYTKAEVVEVNKSTVYAKDIGSDLVRKYDTKTGLRKGNRMITLEHEKAYKSLEALEEEWYAILVSERLEEEIISDVRGWADLEQLKRVAEVLYIDIPTKEELLGKEERV